MSEEQKEKKTLLEALADAFIESWESGLQKAKEIRRTYDQLPPEAKAELEIPDIDLHRLEHDPEWRSWRKDADGRCTFAAEEGKAGWIRIKNAGNTVATLYKAIKRQGLNKVSLGLFEYKLSGDDFLQRRPLKEPTEDPHDRVQRNIENAKKAGEMLTK